MTTVPYTTEQARIDVAALRGQIDLFAEALTQSDGAVVPNQPGALQATSFVSAGQGKYVSGADGNAYNTGNLHLVVPSGGYAGTATLANITGLSASLAAARYRVDGDLIITNQTSGTQAINLGLAGAAINDMRVQFYLFIDATTSASVIGTFSANTMTHWTTVALNGTTLGNNSYLCQIRGTISFSAAGTFGVQTSAAGAFSILQDSFLDIMPVS